MTQLVTLRQYFDAPGAKLTQREALLHLGIGRLSERIRELEAMGYKFLHKMITVFSRYGAARVTEYSLISVPEMRMAA